MFKNNNSDEDELLSQVLTNCLVWVAPTNLALGYDWEYESIVNTFDNMYSASSSYWLLAHI
jgi:hypothetical protein